MALVEPFPDLEEILASIGAGGSHVAAIEASEGAAGAGVACSRRSWRIRGVTSSPAVPITASRTRNTR